MNPHKQHIETFLLLARRGETSRKLNGILEQAPTQAVTSWLDDDSLDVMHHVILARNVEAVEYLLTHGFFVRPHIPAVTPYSHLAALLGQRALLQVLLRHRPDDFYAVAVPILLPDSVIESVRPKNGKQNTQIVIKNHQERPSSSSRRFKTYQIESVELFLKKAKETPNLSISPLEVAATTGQLECVKVVLHQCVLKHRAQKGKVKTPNSDIALATVADSVQSVALLIHTEPPSKLDWEEGVEMCLQDARAECLDVLLQLGHPTKHMFKSMNFYHVLYTYSSNHGLNSYARLAETTEVLVKHGFKVNTQLPCRTFPLYSLLTNSFCFHAYENTQYYIKAARVLLQHGADANFDEVAFEKKNARQAAKKVTGREAFSSALHCLMETVEQYSQYLASPTLAIKFVEDCTSALMMQKANMNQVGHVGPPSLDIQGNILHQLAKSSVEIGVNPEMFRCVLRHGADPNIKVKGKYPINVYFDRLFAKMATLKVVDVKGERMEDAMTILRLCNFMSTKAISDCARIFRSDHGKRNSPQMLPYISAVTKDLLIRSRQIHPLRDLSAWATWKACNCHLDSVRSLNISSELKTYILPMAF